MTQFDLKIVFVFITGVSQKCGDTGKSGKIAASLPVATDSIVRITQMTVDEMTTKRVWTVGRKSMRMRV
jgi:hypothetical protein